MTDEMTMCVQAHCPMAPDCRRQRLTIGKWTSVAAFNFNERGCAYFIPVQRVHSDIEQTTTTSLSQSQEMVRTATFQSFATPPQN